MTQAQMNRKLRQQELQIQTLCVEFGYRMCERGYSIQQAVREVGTVLGKKTSTHTERAARFGFSAKARRK